MKVYDQSLTGSAAAGSSRTQELQRTDRADSSRTNSASSAGGDRVELSGALGTLSRAMAASSSSRASKVQTLSALYQSGGYHPDAAATSRGMVADALASAAK